MDQTPTPNQPVTPPSVQPPANTQPAPPNVLPSAASGSAIAALIVGILAFLSGWIPILGILLGIVAIILGIIALKKGAASKGFGITGIVLGSIGLVVSLLFTLFLTLLLPLIGNDFYNIAREQTAEEQAISEKEYVVGEAVTVDEQTLTVTTVERNFQTGNELIRPETGKEFVAVSITLKNNGTDAIGYDAYDFKIQDSNGVQLNETSVAGVEGNFNSGSLAPGGVVTGKIFYQVPASDAGLKLLFQPDALSETIVTIKL